METYPIHIQRFEKCIDPQASFKDSYAAIAVNKDKF